MSGTKEGGRKSRDINKSLYGEDFYKRIGAMGGAVPHPETRPFSVDRELATRAGFKGGKLSKRTAVPNKRTPVDSL